MRTFRLTWSIVVPAVGIWVVPFLALGVAAVGQTEVATEAGVQVLTRGPVHEAFAAASMTGSTAGVVITKTPYEPIAELPPDQRPDGANVAWIPGYWGYDDDRSDFIWVSGVWRDLPPGRQWVPGYWSPAGKGSQWISGFWGDVAQTEVTYLPAPPAPLEAGPSSPTPGPDHMWASGSWVWQQTRYNWQPGYWVVQQPDWVWAPAHYTWTPRGYVYVAGYWDHDIGHRGVMFAPVYYEQPVYRRPDYFYSPNTIIDLAAMAASLFVQPRSHHYYYGDYYDRRYEERGYYPWYSKQVTRYGVDPIYSHYRAAQLRNDPDWDVHIGEQFRYRRDNVDARPPRTLALQINLVNTPKAGAPANVILGRSFTEAIQSKALPLSFKPVNMDERKQIETRGREVYKLQSERARVETPVKATGKVKGVRETSQPFKMQLPVSPVSARPIEKVEGAKIPPPIPDVPAPQVVEGRGRQVKSKKVEMKTEAPASQDQPLVESRPVTTNVKTKRSTPKSETIKRELTPQTLAPTQEISKEENVSVRTNVKTRTVTPRAQKTNVRSEDESSASETPKSEVRSQKSETEAKTSRSVTKKSTGKREQTSSTEDKKKKKVNER